MFIQYNTRTIFYNFRTFILFIGIYSVIILQGDTMKVLYKQSGQDVSNSLIRFGIRNCYFKKLSVDIDRRSITKKTHHHSGFEMHIVTNGCQKYEVCGDVYTLERGSFLLIYPNVPHTVITSMPDTQKYSITFTWQTDAHRNCFFGKLSERMYSNLTFISNEGLLQKEISSALIENSILETLLSVFRLLGVKENKTTSKQDENVMLSLAKQYIDDNIEMAPSVTDVSEYCCLSTKQLTRIFQRYEDISPGEYIIHRRIITIEKLLADGSFSLKQISERMNFNNEYYFNAFFKKHSGMPPGEYRKMLGQ